MTKTNNKIIKNKENIKMVKYIVEAPEPKKGQNFGSGGIRENGKIASLFKNPVLYEEPSKSPTVVTKNPNTELVRKEQKRTSRNEVRMYLLGLAWQELGEPLLRSGFNKLGKVLISKIEGSTNKTAQHQSSPKPVITIVEADKYEAIYDGEKIIRFPNRRVI